MKKTILILLSFLLIGNFCFADNTGNYKKIISAAADNQDMFAELTDTLEQKRLTDVEYKAMRSHFNSLFKPNQEKEFSGNITEIETEIPLSNVNGVNNLQGVNHPLFNKYPEFIQTCMDAPLTEAITKDPALEIKELKSDRDYTKNTFTLTAITTKGKKINATCNNGGVLLLIMDLWNNTDNTQLKNYRTLHKHYPKIVKMVDNYVYEKTGKKYNKIHPFKCHTLVEVYHVNTSDQNEYWDQVNCMPILYRKDKASNKFDYKTIAVPNWYPIYGINNLIKVNGWVWYDTLTPRKNSPSFDPLKEFAPIPVNDMNVGWLRKLFYSERSSAELRGHEIILWVKDNIKGDVIPNNGTFPIINMDFEEMEKVLGFEIGPSTIDYKPGYFCGKYFSSTYIDHSEFPSKWRFTERNSSESMDFIPNKSLNCDSFTPLLIKRISQVIYPESFNKSDSLDTPVLKF